MFAAERKRVTWTRRCEEKLPKALSRLSYQVKDSEKFGLVSLESAAEQLGIAPYWLRQHMRAHGFKELANGSTYIRLVDLRTLKQHQADISDTARRLRHEQIAEQRAAGRYSARLSWRRQLGVMRRADPGLRALNGGAR